MKNTTLPTAEQITLDWNNNPRWTGIQRNYSAEDVVRLRGTVSVEHSLARRGAELERRRRARHHAQRGQGVERPGDVRHPAGREPPGLGRRRVGQQLRDRRPLARR